MLKGNKSLEVLLLRDNSIKDSGGQALCEVARFNQNIVKISLELNPMNFKFISEIKVYLRNNELLKKQSQVPQLQAVLEKNQVRSSEIGHILNKITQKVKEQGEAENKLKSQGERLQVMRDQEREKLEELKKEYSEIKRSSNLLSSEIENINTQIHVRNK